MSSAISLLSPPRRLAVAVLAALACLLSAASGPQPASADVIAPDHIVVTVSPWTPVAGQEAFVTAVAVDAAGTKLVGYSGGAKWGDSAGALADWAPADFVRGVSRTAVKFGTALHGDVITVNDSSFGAVGSSRPFEVIGPVARIGVSVPATVPAGVAFTVTSRAYDALGHVVTGYAGRATWRHTVAGASLSPDAPSDFARGVSSTLVTAGAPVRGDALTVTTGGLSGTSRTFTVQGPIDHLDVSIPRTIKLGVPFTLVVTARDGNGSTVTTYNHAGGWSDPNDAGPLGSGSLNPFVAGVSRTTVVRTAPELPTFLAVLTDDHLSVWTSTFAVLGPFDHLAGAWTRTGSSAQECVGLTGSLTVIALDAVGNRLTSYSGAISWSVTNAVGDATIGPAAPARFVNAVSENPTVTINGSVDTAINLTVRSGGSSWVVPLVCGAPAA